MLTKEPQFYLNILKEKHDSVRDSFSMSDLRALKQIEFLTRLSNSQMNNYFENLISNIIKYTDYVLIFSKNFSKDNNTEYLINSLDKKRKNFFNKLFGSKNESVVVPAQLKSLYSQIAFYQNRINVIYNQMTEVKEQLLFSKSIIDIEFEHDHQIRESIEKNIKTSLPTLAILEETVNSVKISIYRTKDMLENFVEEYYPALFREQKHLLISAVDNVEGFESNKQNTEKVEILKILKKTILHGIYEFKEYNAYYRIKDLTIKSSKHSSGAKNAIMIQNTIKDISEKIEVFLATLNKYEKVLESKIKELDQQNNQNVEDKINNMPLISECKALLTEISILKEENKELLKTLK